MTGTLHRHVAHFRERNVFAHAALGLLSAGGRFEAFWDEVLAGVPRTARRRAAPPREIFVVLGALRVSRHLRSLLVQFAAEPLPVAPAPSPATPHFPVPRRVLR